MSVLDEPVDSVAVDKEATDTAAEQPVSTSPDGSTSETKDKNNKSDEQYPVGPKLLLAGSAMILCLLIGGLDANIVAVAVPSITDHFHTIADVGWYSAAYRLAACSVQFSWGKLYKMYDRKRLFIISQAILFVGSLFCAAATSSSMFVVGRAITGVGIAGGSAGFFNIIMIVVSPRLRPTFGAIFGVVETLSGLIAPFLGGVITQHLSWRWCFWINLPVLGTALIIMIFLLPKSTPSSKDTEPTRTVTERLRELDIVGTVLLAGCLTALCMAFNWGGITYSWSNARIIALFVVFAVLLVVLLVHQVRFRKEGILPLHILRNRNVWGGALFSLCTLSTLSIEEYYAPTYFQAVKGYSPTRSGYMMFPCLVGTVVGFLLQGPGTSKIGYYTPFMIASSILMPVAAGLLSTWGLHTSLAPLIVYFALAGFAAGVGFQCPLNSAQTALPEDDVPLGIAAVLFAQNLGPTIFVSIAQLILTNSLSEYLGQHLPDVTAAEVNALPLSDLRNVFQGDELRTVLVAIKQAISHTWYLATALAALSIVGSLATQWLSVKDNSETATPQTEEKDAARQVEKEA